MKNKKTLILSIILIAGVIIIFSSLQPNRSSRISTVGSTVPDFELIDLNKNTINISDFKGSVVLINFWATWCQSCIDELPSLERLHRILSPNPKFKIVTVLFKDEGSRALDFMKAQGYTFPVYMNPDEYAARTFGLTGVPETYIIDKKGVLRDKVIGPADWDTPRVIEAFTSLINET